MTESAAPPPPPPRHPLLACCQGCKHVWPTLWLPCNAVLIGKAVPKCCPMCGTTKKTDIVVASWSDGDFVRYADWLECELVRARAAAAVVGKVA